jgi:hypothetical protein
VDASPKEQSQFLYLHRLAQKIVGARANRLKSIPFFTLPRNDDDLGRTIDNEYFGQRRQSFIAFIGARWQTQIKQRHRRGVGLEGFKGPFSVFGEMNFVILAQRPFHLSPDRFVVIDDEQFVFHAI